MNRILYLCIFISSLFSSKILFNPLGFDSNESLITNPHIIAIMVEFQEDSSVLTSGNGLFLDDLNIDIIWDESDRNRCEGYIVDRPPHDSLYFSKQIEAVSNYFKAASNENIQISSKIITNQEPGSKGRYRLDYNMEYYAISDNMLSELFKESLQLTKPEIETYLSNENIDLSQVIFTIFHAGIGQDFTFPTFDPTIYDIKSAYIEESMFSGEFPLINNQEIKSGILLPETQNLIFFDGIEDIFYGYESYCDFQLGMTGTFSFLLGYALGFPPLFNTETGRPGVGVFGLMDYGANNGRGVIPSIPSPWTRILNDWIAPINMTDSCSVNPLIFDLDSDAVYKFDISDDEYFLIENRSNKLEIGEALIDIVSDYNNQLNNDSLNYYSNWFDALDNYGGIFSTSGSYVITEVSNYDLGLPGSGILIWHIKEPSDITSDFNNDPNNKMIHIEEADGALDIGFESYALFSNDDPTNGTKWDLWYLGNDAYHYTNGNDEVCINPESYEILNEYNYQFICEQNNGVWINRIIFDKYSNPSSDLNDGIQSFFSFELLDSISQDVKRVKVKYESPLDYMDYSHLSDFKISGTSPTHIFFYKDTMFSDSNPPGDIEAATVYSFDIQNNILNNVGIWCPHQFMDDSFYLQFLTDSNDIVNGYCFFNDTEQLPSIPFAYLDPNNQYIQNDYMSRFGYFNNSYTIDEFYIYHGNDNYFSQGLDNLSLSTADVSIGDVDYDGLDEIIWTSDGKIMAANYNGTMVNGFPIKDNYHGIVLILENEDDEIILVSRNNSYIDILSLNGDVLYSLPSIGDQDIMVISGKLTDGVRFYDFPIGDGSYWLQRHSQHSHYPLPSGEHVVPDYENSNQKITNFYNYPNPITDRETTFRFMVHEQIDIDIKIYNLSGYLIDELKMSSQNITQHEYNEIQWNCSNLLPGLYFAEIISDNGQEHIIKMVVGH